MPGRHKTTLLVVLTGASALLALTAAWPSADVFPGWWAVCTFGFVAFVLESLHTDLRVAAKGSTSFILHLAGCLLFGAFWGGTITGAATLVTQITSGNSPLKSVFNVSQRVLAVVVAA